MVVLGGGGEKSQNVSWMSWILIECFRIWHNSLCHSKCVDLKCVRFDRCNCKFDKSIKNHWKYVNKSVGQWTEGNTLLFNLRMEFKNEDRSGLKSKIGMSTERYEVGHENKMEGILSDFLTVSANDCA